MQALEERRRGKEEEESEDDDGDQFEDEDEIRASRRKWWRRALSLFRRRETGEGSTHQRFGRDTVTSESRVATSFLDRLVIHPDNWYGTPIISLSLSPSNLLIHIFFIFDFQFLISTVCEYFLLVLLFPPSF